MYYLFCGEIVLHDNDNNEEQQQQHTDARKKNLVQTRMCVCFTGKHNNVLILKSYECEYTPNRLNG